MKTITVDFKQDCGKMKPMNAVNNGPKRLRKDQVSCNFDDYKNLRLPYARTHDSALCYDYGGPYTVDITGVFPYFDADENDPESYDFTNTDEYLLRIIKAGTRVFYRLGQSIEHTVRKHGTIPPKDFHKWARICEHIIRHYNEGWANGYYLDIDYWEIWNEPDLDPDDSPNKRCWGGTKTQFFELYEIAAKHLKSCFPILRIGGPALAHGMEWADEFLAYMEERRVPIDFFSWHRYHYEPEKFIERGNKIREMLNAHGYTETTSILNEWNYVKNWTDQWIYSLEVEAGRKGGSFATASMALGQYSNIDMMMYYDARVNTDMNGLFKRPSMRPGNTYYPFYGFAEVAKLGDAVSAETEENLYAVAAKSYDDKYGALLTYYTDDDTAPAEDVCIRFKGVKNPGKVRVDIFRMDDKQTPVRSEIFTSQEFAVYCHAELFDVFYVKIREEA